MSFNPKKGAVNLAHDLEVDEVALPAVCAGAVFSMAQADDTPSIASSANPTTPALNMRQNMLSSIMPEMA